MKSQMNGVWSLMMTFNFFFGISLAKVTLSITNSLANLLQKKKKNSALEGKELNKPTLNTLKDMRSTEFDKFWEDTLKISVELEKKR